MTKYLRSHRCFGVVWIILLGLAACRPASATVTSKAPAPTLTQAPGPSLTASIFPTAMTPAATPTATETPQPPLAVLLAPAGSDSVLADGLQAGLEKALAEAGLRWEKRSSITGQEAGLRLVVALPPDPGIASLAAASPQVQFLAVGIPGVQPGANLSLVGAEGDRLDQRAFMIGYLAALITPDWRVGVLSVTDTLEGKLARMGFVNGAAYFCGLCLAYHGPNFDYPVYAEQPSSAGPAEWQAAAQSLVDKAVQTVFIAPGAGDEASINLLVQSGAHFIGSQPATEALRSRWVASVISDPLPAIQQLLPDLLKGSGGLSLPMTIQFMDVNPNLLSPGRIQLAEKVTGDLVNGLIDTGVDPLTGEPH